MFNVFKKKVKKNQKKLSLKIDGMHCSSCSMNIDGELEDLEGVYSASTSYARQESTVEFDPELVSDNKIRETITSLGYSVK